MASRRYEIGVGLLLVASLAVTAFMATRIGAFAGLAGRIDVEVEIEDAAGITPGAVVAVSGVEVGTVRRMRVEHDVAVVELALDPKAELRRDAEVRVRARSVLGERYVELIPRSRTAPRLVDGDRLARVGTQTEIDEIVNRLGPMLTAMDPEALGRVLVRVDEALADDPERLSRMLAHADQLLENLALASASLPATVDEGRRALRVVEDAAREVSRRAIDSEPLVREARAAVQDGRALMASLEPTAEDLARIAERLAALDDERLERVLQEEGIRVRLFGPARKRGD